MYDIKFPQVVSTPYITNCVGCPYMKLTADTTVDTDRSTRRHMMKCKHLEICLRIIGMCQEEQAVEDEEERQMDDDRRPQDLSKN